MNSTQTILRGMRNDPDIIPSAVAANSRMNPTPILVSTIELTLVVGAMRT